MTYARKEILDIATDALAAGREMTYRINDVDADWPAAESAWKDLLYTLATVGAYAENNGAGGLRIVTADREYTVAL